MDSTPDTTTSPDSTGDAAPLALIVVNDEELRRLCRPVLERKRWRVIEAAAADEMLAAIHAQQPEVILLDIDIDRADALTLIRLVREDAVGCDIPVVVTSRRVESEIVAAALDAGADEVLTKPPDTCQLETRLRGMARLRRALIELNASRSCLGHQSHAMTLLQDFAAELDSADALDDILDRIIVTAARLTGCRRISLLLPDRSRSSLCMTRSLGMEQAATPKTIRGDESVAWTAFIACEPVVFQAGDEAAAAMSPADTFLFRGIPLVSAPLVCASGRAVGVLNVSDRINGEAFSAQELESLRLVCHFAASAIRVARVREARDQARDAIVVALAELVEHRDYSTGRHLDRVTAFCLQIAEALREIPRYAATIDDNFLKNLRRAAPLHDIGKVATPDAILLKPGRLTPEEIDVMQTHVMEGANTIRSMLAKCPESDFLYMAEEIALGHHEWFNGRGYPRGLACDAIPLSARIAALADVYDALTTRRVYKEAYTHEQAVKIIREASGTQFDPEIVDAFNRCERRIAALALEMTDAPPPAEWVQPARQKSWPARVPANV